MTKDFSAAKAIANAKRVAVASCFPGQDNLHGLRFDEDLALHEDMSVFDPGIEPGQPNRLHGSTAVLCLSSSRFGSSTTL